MAPPEGVAARQEACAVVPAFQASATVGAVVEDARAALGVHVLVVDDGSSDATAEVARRHGAEVISHGRNRGKGAAIVTGLRRAAASGFRMCVTIDADGQHPTASSRAVLDGSDDPSVLVLGIRDLARDGAPRLNRFSNGASNLFVSGFARRPLRDTQCGLRRYPIEATLALGARATGYAFEAEVLLRASAARVLIVEVPVVVIYPSGSMRHTHFHSVRDPVRIAATIARTVLSIWAGR